MSRSLPTILFLGFLCAADSSRPACPFVIDTPPADLRLRIFVTNAARVPEATLGKAEEITSLVYQNAGIELEWLRCPANGEPPEQYPDCRPPFSPLDLFLKILSASDRGLTPNPSSFGVARIGATGFSRTAYVNFDRVENWTWDGLRSMRFVSLIPPGDRCPVTLGVVMAHEAGHLLLGSNSHSAKGIMRPHWSQQDLDDAYEGRQSFNPRETKRLRENVQARAAAVPLAVSELR